MNTQANRRPAGLRAWCRAHGVPPSTLAKALTEGRVARMADGSLDVESADLWLTTRGTTPPRQPRRSGAPRPGSVAAAQRRLYEYRARIARLEWLRRKGELVDVEAVKEAAFTTGRTLRDAMQAIPARVSPVLASVSDPAEVNRILEAEVALALENLSGSFDARPRRATRRTAP